MAENRSRNLPAAPIESHAYLPLMHKLVEQPERVSLHPSGDELIDVDESITIVIQPSKPPLAVRIG